jgi:hypothetical protein
LTEETEPEDVKPQEEKGDKLTVHTLFSILVLVTGIFLLPTSGFVFWLLSGSLFEIFSVIAGLLGLLAVCGILEIIGSIGLFKKRPWGRTLTIWVVFIAFLAYVALVTNIAAFGATYGVGIADVPAFAVPVFIILLGPILIHLTIFTYFFTVEGKRPFAPDARE